MGVPHHYNLAEDIHEDHDMAALHQDIVQQMMDIIRKEHRENAMFPITLPYKE